MLFLCVSSSCNRVVELCIYVISSGSKAVSERVYLTHMSSGYIKRLAIVEPTAPDIAWPTAGSLYSSNEIGSLSLIRE